MSSGRSSLTNSTNSSIFVFLISVIEKLKSSFKSTPSFAAILSRASIDGERKPLIVLDVSPALIGAVMMDDCYSPPVANADGPYKGEVDQPVTFDGSGFHMISMVLLSPTNGISAMTVSEQVLIQPMPIPIMACSK